MKRLTATVWVELLGENHRRRLEDLGPDAACSSHAAAGGSPRAPATSSSGRAPLSASARRTRLRNVSGWDPQAMAAERLLPQAQNPRFEASAKPGPAQTTGAQIRSWTRRQAFGQRLWPLE